MLEPHSRAMMFEESAGINTFFSPFNMSFTALFSEFYQGRSEG
jgi:hypothetical protein